MHHYEIRIDGPDESALEVRVLCAAGTWIEAWHEALDVLGEPPASSQAVGVLAGERVVHVQVPSSQRTYVIRELDELEPDMPAPARGRPILVTKRRQDKGSRANALRVHAVSPTTLRSDRPARLIPGDPSLEDPAARILNTKERLRITDREGASRRRNPTRLGLPAAPNPANEAPQPASDGARTAVDLHAINAALPQQFRAVAAGGNPTDALSKAVDTAWQHVECRMVQLLKWTDDETLEVIEARGERALESDSCTLKSIDSFAALSGMHPSRVRFPRHEMHLAYCTADQHRVKVEVRSAICVPIFVEEDPYGVMLLIDSARELGFDDGELRAITYLASTVARSLESNG